MFELIRRTRILLVILSIVLTFLIYFVIYSPMMAEIQHSMYLNITEISMSKYSSIQNSVDAAVTGSLSLSSRSAIRDKISEYKNGDISLEELSAFTAPKYADGASVLDKAVFAQRIVDEQPVATYQAEGFNAPGLAGTEKYAHAVSSQFIHSNGILYIKVFSPILKDGEEIGMDVVLFDFSDKLNNLNESAYKVRMIDATEFNRLQQGADILLAPDDSILLNNNKNIYFLKSMDSHYFLVQADRQIVFAQADALTRNIIIAWIIIFAVMLLTIYFYLLRYANKRIRHAEQSRDHFKSMAYTDRMTGLYSRSYLEIWKTGLRDTAANYTLVMVDVDDFKLINDQFGHLAGDEVLTRIANLFLSSIRESDIIIRFGGDEFLIIMEHADESSARKLMDRMNETLAHLDDCSVPLRLSFGTSELGPGEDFDAALGQADERMYTAKNQKDTPDSGDQVPEP
jgi:diguanylate cyclase (GGDEF)-like protein